MKDTMLLFDLDGTLWDSGQEVAFSWNEILLKELPEAKLISSDDMHSVMGLTMTEIAEKLFPGIDTESRSEVFEKCMIHENEYLYEHGANLFPDVPETLEKLKASGYSLAVVSNCQKGYIDAFLHSMNTGRYFTDYEEWGRTGLSKAENIRLVMERNGFAKGIYIGDTQKDGDSARAAGIPFIHAEYGFGKVKEADGVISGFKELPAVIDNLVL